jgi:hypothetical protein
MPFDLSEDEKLALTALLTSTIDHPAPAFATGTLDPISGSCALI